MLEEFLDEHLFMNGNLEKILQNNREKYLVYLGCSGAHEKWDSYPQGGVSWVITGRTDLFRGNCLYQSGNV